MSSATANRLRPKTTDRAESPQHVYVVCGSGRSFANTRGRASKFHVIKSENALLHAFLTAKRDSVWVAWDPDCLAPLAAQAVPCRGEQRLLVLDEMREVTHHLFSALFRYVVTKSARLKMLPTDELIEVLSSPSRRSLFIAGAVDTDRSAVLLYRGDVEPLVIPLNWFSSQSSGTRPDPGKFEIRDYGQTVALGEFEASADAILYELDPAYRRAAKKRELDHDQSLGAAIRRLRLQKGLARHDFPGIAEKSLARIERNEVRPREKTLDIIAERLGVDKEDLSTF